MDRRAGFLDLPGEIRNEIYELVVQSMQKESDMLTLVHLPRTKGPPQASGYRGFTQLCQQVRHEFLPLWQQRHVYVEIDICDTARFVETFYDFTDARAMADANGSIEVSLDREVSGDDAPSSVDLLPFLRLMILAPRLHSRFVAMKYIQKDGPPKYISDLVTISRLAKVEKDELRHHFLCTLTQLILMPLPSPSPGAPPPSLQLRLSPEFSCYDLSFRHKLLHETGFYGLRTLKVLTLVPNRDWCEDLKRVDYRNYDRLQFEIYSNSGGGLPRKRRPYLRSQPGDIDGRDEAKAVEKLRKLVVVQQENVVQQKSDGQLKSSEEQKTGKKQKSGVRGRLRGWLQNWGMRRKSKKNTVIVS